MTSRRNTLRAASLALFAMLLIVFAPLVSITLQKVSGSPVQMMMHHDMPMMSMPEHHEHHQHHSGMDADKSEHTQTLSKQHQDALQLMEHAGACGYCVLLAQVPGLLLLVAVLIGGNLRLQRVSIAAPVISLWLFIPWLYPHTRAPPRHCAFSY